MTYDSMMLSCMDPRMTGLVQAHMADRGLAGRYSHVALAGGCLWFLAFPSWGRTFFANLALSVERHGISRLIVVNHRDCAVLHRLPGCVRGPNAHRVAMQGLRAEVASRHPKLAFEGILMDLDGRVETLVKGSAI